MVYNDLLVYQCIVFFVAGFETIATTLASCLYELTKCYEAQRRMQEEVDEYMCRHDNKQKYELLYLDACVNETIWFYPVLPLLKREVVEDYTFPAGLKVEKGLRIHLPIYYFHHNPEYFAEPEDFRPERFLPDARESIKPYTFSHLEKALRFVLSSGTRFAKMQAIAGLITNLKKYSVKLADGTPTKLEFETTTMLTPPTCNLALKFTPRGGWEQRVFAR